MDIPALRACLILRATKGLGDRALCRLLEIFRSAETALKASEDALVGTGILSPPVVEAVKRGPDRRTLHQIDRELTQLERSGISLMTCLDPAYPERLKMIADPPPLLYVKGRLTEADQAAVAVVGARKASPEGILVTEQFSRDLAAVGFTIVSGLARGIDGAAHRGALEAGRTIAVLGCGLDRTYPPEHRRLRERIEASAAVLSELPLGTPPHGHHFPRRNRIISGMSLGVLVTEAGEQSGSLITARMAAEQGRDVWAVPGCVRRATSRGTHGLIKQGAALVESVDDVVREVLPQLEGEFMTTLRQRQAQRLGESGDAPLADEELAIATLFGSEPTDIDDLIARSGWSVGDVMRALLSLELKGCVRQLPGNRYIRVKFSEDDACSGSHEQE